MKIHLRSIPGTAVLAVVLCLAFTAGLHAAAAETTKLSVLILSGSNNHNWKQTTPALQQILESSGRFKVDVTERPEQCTAESLKGYDALLSNWNSWGKDAKTYQWPEPARQAMLGFVRNGKGFVVVHAGGSSFYDWPEYQQMVGASWKMGETGHGARHAFTVRITGKNHPITRGLRDFPTQDELWHRTGLQPGMKPLATAFSAKDAGGSGADEPMALVHEFGKGRTFVLLLGHDAAAMEPTGFRALLQRGTEWAATGRVTLQTGEPALGDSDLDAKLAELKSWRFGQPRAAQLALEEHIGAIGNDAAKRDALAKRLVALLGDAQTSPDAKGICCRLLSLTGSAAQVSALAKLLADKDLAMLARFALERIGGDEAANALLTALQNGAGVERVGLINSLGQLRYAPAAKSLSEFAKASDPAVASAAVVSLGQIASADAAAVLLGMPENLPVPVAAAWNRAALTCANTHLMGGRKETADRLFERLMKPSHPAVVRAAAFKASVIPWQTDEDGRLIGSIGAPEIAKLRAAITGNDLALQRGALDWLRSHGMLDLWTQDALAKDFRSLRPEAQAELLPLLAIPHGPAASAGEDPWRVTARTAMLAGVASSDAAIRLEAVRNLGKVGKAEDINLLLPLAAGDNDPLRDAARRSLQQLRGEAVDQWLISVVKSAEGKQKAEAISALTDRGATDATAVMLGALRDRDAAVQDQAQRGLASLGGSEQAHWLTLMLEQNPPESLRRRIESVLVVIGRRDAAAGATTATLCGALKNGDAATRTSLIAVLGGVGGEKALAALKGALQDNDPDARVAAVRALGNWSDPTPAEDLVAFAAKTDDAKCKVLALRGAARLVTQAKKLPPAAAAKILDKAILAAAGTGEEDALKAAKSQLGSGGRGAGRRSYDGNAAALFTSPDNLARGAKATNPDGLKPDGQGQGPHAAVDGDPKTYWDEVDGQKLYQIRVELKQRATVAQLRILAWAHHNYAPKDFEILCDDKLVKKVIEAEYDNALLTVDLPPTECQSVQLNITGYYPRSPAIRELGIYGKTKGK